MVVTHGNGPQVGLLALQSEAYAEVAPYPLDVLGAESEGMIGYLLEQELGNALGGRPVATLLTQVLVDRDDPAFARPTKPIGPLYERRDGGAPGAPSAAGRSRRTASGYRRVVASPEPRGIVELATIRLLRRSGRPGGLRRRRRHPRRRATTTAGCAGVEAVIDKDLAAALLACELGADALLLLTDVAAVEAGWGTPEARPLRRVLGRRAAGDGLRTPGSMGPKVEAACRFAETTRRARPRSAPSRTPPRSCEASAGPVSAVEVTGAPPIEERWRSADSAGAPR